MQFFWEVWLKLNYALAYFHFILDDECLDLSDAGFFFSLYLLMCNFVKCNED